MKLNTNRKKFRQGSTLIITLLVCTLLLITLAGYLATTQHQNYLSYRSQVWNASIAVSEAGVEEALQHINANSPNLDADGWSKNGNTYSRSQDLSDTASYAVSIDASDIDNPQITSWANVTVPTLAALLHTPMMAEIGTTVYSPNRVRRGIKVTAGRDSLFLVAMVARDLIDMNGNDVRVDSFDSTDSNHSDNGMYPTSQSKRKNNGDVASNLSVTNAISVGNANIYGHAIVGHGGTVAVGPNGGVGSYWWQWSNNGIEPGYFRDDANFTFPKIELPYSSGLTPDHRNVEVTNLVVSSTTVTSPTYPSPVPPSGVQTNIVYVTTNAAPNPQPSGTVINTETVPAVSTTYPADGTYYGEVTQRGHKFYYDLITGYTYTFPVFTYTYDTYTTNYNVTTEYYEYVLDGNDDLTMPPTDYYVSEIPSGNVYVRGNARLVVAGNYKQSAHDELVIATDGKLEMYVGGTSVDLSGNGVMNKNGYAQDFMLFCTDSVTDIHYRGNGEFTGAIVAPYANVRLSGGGNSVEDFIGALIANSVTLNGHYSFHFDEALKSYKDGTRYLITSWEEL